MKYYIIALVVFFACFYSHEIGFMNGSMEQRKLDNKKLTHCHQIINKDLYGNVE